MAAALLACALLLLVWTRAATVAPTVAPEGGLALEVVANPAIGLDDSGSESNSNDHSAEEDTDTTKVVWSTDCGSLAGNEREACCMRQWEATRIDGDVQARIVDAHVGPTRFRFAVYAAQQDIVSDSIANTGQWEESIAQDMLRELAAGGAAAGGGGEGGRVDLVDIGSNVGWFPVVLAVHGRTVVAFEPSRQNTNLMKLSVCVNPDVAPRITLHVVGLGTQPQDCVLYSQPGINIGDGHLACGDPPAIPATYAILERLKIGVFDELFGAPRRHVGLLKIDTEGFEYFAMSGAAGLLADAARSPRIIFSEFGPGMMREKGANPADYLRLLYRSGYKCEPHIDAPEDQFEGFVQRHAGNMFDLRCVKK